jgi:hypothetical protein
MAEQFEAKIEKEEILEMVESLMNFYKPLETIQDYFLERKKEKIVGLDDSCTKTMFTDYTIEPKDMNFELELIDAKTFNPAAQIITSLPLEAQIGRQITVGVRETTSDKWVGFIRMASPVLSIKPRNDFFGQKVEATQVNRSMFNGSVIVPVQPFGYNYLGGKLLALFCCSHEMKQLLKDKYGDKIDTCFFETTSLYGDLKGVSMYDGLKPFIRYQALTESKLFLFPSEEVLAPLRSRVRELYGKEEWRGNTVDPKPSGPKMREFNKLISIFKNHLRLYDMEKYAEFHEFTKSHMKAKTKKRYYYSDFGYGNVVEHVNSGGEIPLEENKQNFHKFKKDFMVEWWRKKAQNRYTKLKDEGRIRTEMEIYTLDRINNKEVDMVR